MERKSKLIPCKHCGTQISRSAKTCPHCGVRNKKSIIKRFWFWIVILLVLAYFGNWGGISNRIQPVLTTLANSVGDIAISTGQSKEPETQAKTTDESTAKVTAKVTAEVTAEEVSQTSKTATDKNGVSIEFKEKMDSYEAFFDEYAEFMKKYNNSSDTTSMLMDYASFLTKYADAMNAIDSIDESKLSKADNKYYIKVMARITVKLAEAAESMD